MTAHNSTPQIVSTPSARAAWRRLLFQSLLSPCNRISDAAGGLWRVGSGFPVQPDSTAHWPFNALIEVEHIRPTNIHVTASSLYALPPSIQVSVGQIMLAFRLEIGRA